MSVKGGENVVDEASSTSSKKEVMLKKLLEQQEIYIAELERKNREMKEQIITNHPSQMIHMNPT